MPEPQPRKRFQIHLSTAIVLMFIAGGLIWMNTVEQKNFQDLQVFSEEFEPLFNHSPKQQTFVVRAYGFPSMAYFIINELDDSVASHQVIESKAKLFKSSIATNIAATILILFSVWYACEWTIRRRALKKGP